MFDLGDLRKHDPNLVRRLLRQPAEAVPPFEEALKEQAREQIERMDPEARKVAEQNLQDDLRIGFTGPFGFHRVTPRELMSTFLSSMVRIEGVVTRASLITPKLQRSVHYCPVRNARRAGGGPCEPVILTAALPSHNL